MSEEHLINYGYVTPVVMLRNVVAPDKLDQFDAMMKAHDGDAEELERQLPGLLPPLCPKFEGVFIPEDTDLLDGQLSVGVAYIWFEDEALLDIQPNAFLKFLHAFGVEPAFSAWAHWA